MERGHTINVLDHGYVKLIDWMGSDEAIVEAARMSTGRGFVSWEQYKRCKKCDFVDVRSYSAEGMPEARQEPRCEHDWQDFPRGDFGMLDSLYKNKHSTPFEFGELHIEVQAPLMVFREWHRHRTQSYSEFSARYSQMPDLHYVPELSRIQKQSKSNRQGSAEALPEDDAKLVQAAFMHQQGTVYDYYDKVVAAGFAKEVARINTPVSRYSKMRAKTDLRNWLAFLLLRKASAAQFEIRQYADAVGEMVKAIWPRIYSIFEEHDFFGVHLSRTEARAIREIIYGLGDDESGLGQKGRKALLEKLGVAA